tara:strand:+ start:988 stop:1476 length:489 start_codon:yes stop_codon:yes gene_type:complete
MEIVKDSADHNRDAVVEGVMNAKIFVLNVAMATIEETVITDRKEVALIAGLKDKDNAKGTATGFVLDAHLWDATDSKKEVEFVHVLATKNTNHAFDMQGVLIKTPSGKVQVEFGTVLIMKMNPLTGDLRDVEITEQEIDQAIRFFSIPDSENVMDMFSAYQV